MDLKTLSEIASNLVTAVGVFVGAFWVLWQFSLNREAHAKIEFDLELVVLGMQDEWVLVEIVAVVTNKGKVRHWLRDLGFKLLYLPKGSHVEFGDDLIRNQVVFQTLFEDRYWTPRGEFFVDPGVTQRFRHISAVPAAASFVLVLAGFKYRYRASGFHTAQKAWSIQQLLGDRAAMTSHGSPDAELSS